MSHERSETIQRGSKWINVYGRGTKNAGRMLPGSGEFDTVEQAVEAAKKRSESFGMTIVEVQGVGEVEFPDDMTTEQIQAVLQKQFPAQPKGIVDTAIGNVKQTISTLTDPETYKQIGRELTNFPPATDPSQLGAPENVQRATDIALSVLPTTALGKAARAIVTGREADDLTKLAAEGIKPTIGQKVGGAAKRTEEALTSVPVLGDVIKGAQFRGIEDFNRAAINRTLKPIGKSLPKNLEVGNRAVDYAHSILSRSYDDILPKLSGNLDDTLSQSIKSTVDDFATQLPEQQAKQLSNIVQRDVLMKFDAGRITGEKLKDSLSRLGKLIRQYGKSENPDHQVLSEGLQGIRQAVNDMLQRYNPQFAKSLKNIDTGYANLIRVEKAASSTGAKNGIFTPAQLGAAVKATDASLRKSGFARGKALMQDLSTAGQNVLSQTLPDSGTALRLSPYLLAGGAGVAGQQGYISPEVAAAIIGLTAAYTRPGQAFLGSTLRSPVVQRGALSATAQDPFPSLRRRNLAP